MAIKHQCKDIWGLWKSGWICIPTSPDHPSNKFSSLLGRFLVSKFPGLEKNYNRLCDVKKGDFALFISTHTRGNNPKRILAYNDLRIPLSSEDYGLILLPDSTSKEIGKNTEKTDWEVIEESVNILKENYRAIPGKIFIPPLGFGENKLREEEAVDDLMAMFLDFNRIEIVYNISIEEEEIKEEIKEEKPKENKELIDSYSSENSNQNWDGENLINDEFERIEIRLPDQD